MLSKQILPVFALTFPMGLTPDCYLTAHRLVFGTSSKTGSIIKVSPSVDGI